MIKRTLSGIFILGVLIISLCIGNIFFGIVTLICAEIGFYELFNVKYGEKGRKLEFIKFIGYISLFIIMMNGVLYEINNIITLIIPLLGLTLPIVFYNNSEKYNINDSLYVLGAVFFLGFAFSTIIELRNIDLYKCAYIFIIAFVTDTYAYIGGCLVGKHKLTTISPKKTWEGSIIGSIMGIIIGSVYLHSVAGDISLLEVILLSGFLTVLSELGDLVFSSIKRYFKKKDYSNLIPGHGGILDRFDSVIYVALGMALIFGLW